jgi:hypothetical protein
VNNIDVTYTANCAYVKAFDYSGRRVQAGVIRSNLEGLLTSPDYVTTFVASGWERNARRDAMMVREHLIHAWYASTVHWLMESVNLNALPLYASHSDVVAANASTLHAATLSYEQHQHKIIDGVYASRDRMYVLHMCTPVHTAHNYRASMRRTLATGIFPVKFTVEAYNTSGGSGAQRIGFHAFTYEFSFPTTELCDER